MTPRDRRHFAGGHYGYDTGSQDAFVLGPSLSTFTTRRF